MLYTLLQITAFQSLFLLVYDMLLKQETFFNYNRLYLIVTSVLALVLPFVKFSELQQITTKNMVIQLPEVFIGTKTPSQYEVFVAEQAGIILDQPQTPLWQIVLYTGIGIATLFFVFKISKLLWLKHVNPKRWKGNVLIVELIKSSAAFSFFNTIFLGDRISEAEKTAIYKHELVHVKQWHTLDLLFFELLRIVFWFNPLVYIYQNRIKELHEFIADAKAVKQNGKSEYYKSLLNQIFDVNTISFTNTFFKKSLIKKRIAMLQKSKSKQIKLIKYAVLIPVVLSMLIYTSVEVRAQEKIEQQEITISQQLTDKELIKKCYQELVKMEKEGATFIEISEYAGITNKQNNKYVLSKEEYLKINAYLEYLANITIERKSNDGTLTTTDIETAENIKMLPHENYEAYRQWKKTQEAKDLWEAGAKDGELRFVVNSLDKMTDKEQKHFDRLVKQLGDDPNFNRLIVCETKGGSRLELTDPQGPDVSTKQIKAVQDVEVPFSVIEEVPTTKECKDLLTNVDRKECMSQFITKYVNKNFNIGLADSLGIKGRQRIFVSFKIDKQGLIQDVRARASHPELEIEAKRIIRSLPEFIPGRQKGKTVVVPYSLPITFQIANDSALEPIINRDSIENTPNYKAFIEQLRAKDSVLEDRTKIFRQYMVEKIMQNEEETINNAIKKSKALDKIPFSVVEVSPTHPDCNTIEVDEERKKCTSRAVQILVNKNFNLKMAEALNLPDGEQQIFTSFVIDKKGFVKDIKARASHDRLKEEAIRVLSLLPQFTPGEHNGKKVDVPYSLPITFRFANSKKKKN